MIRNWCRPRPIAPKSIFKITAKPPQPRDGSDSIPKHIVYFQAINFFFPNCGHDNFDFQKQRSPQPAHHAIRRLVIFHDPLTLADVLDPVRAKSVLRVDIQNPPRKFIVQLRVDRQRVAELVSIGFSSLPADRGYCTAQNTRSLIHADTFRTCAIGPVCLSHTLFVCGERSCVCV